MSDTQSIDAVRPEYCKRCGLQWSLDPWDVHSPFYYGKDAHQFEPGEDGERGLAAAEVKRGILNNEG